MPELSRVELWNNQVVKQKLTLAPTAAFVNEEREYEFTGDGTSDDVELPRTAHSGTTRIMANVGENDVGAYPWRRKTVETTTDNWKYEEVLDDSGDVLAVRPKNTWDLGTIFVVYYSSLY